MTFYCVKLNLDQKHFNSGDRDITHCILNPNFTQSFLLFPTLCNFLHRSVPAPAQHQKPGCPAGCVRQWVEVHVHPGAWSQWNCSPRGGRPLHGVRWGPLYASAGPSGTRPLLRWKRSSPGRPWGPSQRLAETGCCQRCSALQKTETRMEKSIMQFKVTSLKMTANAIL